MKQYFIEDNRGRFFKSKSTPVKQNASSFKWTSDITHSTAMTNQIANELKGAFYTKGIEVNIKEL